MSFSREDIAPEILFRFIEMNCQMVNLSHLSV